MPTAEPPQLSELCSQDVRYGSRMPARLHQLCAVSEPVQALQFDLSVHAGERAGRPRVYDSLTTPIVQVHTDTSCRGLRSRGKLETWFWS